MSEGEKSCWLVILPWKSFYMVGAPCAYEEALEDARKIWPDAEVE